MSAATERLNNELPDVVVAVCTHRIVQAKLIEKQAVNTRRMMERMAKAAGVPIGAVTRMGRTMTMAPAKMRRLAEEESIIARGTRAGVQIEPPSLFDSTTDVSDAEWERRVRDEGYGAAVWCLPADTCPYSEPENVDLWNAGHAEFHADLRAYAAHEELKRQNPVPTGELAMPEERG